DINELIEKKMEKEANRFIKQWPTEKIAIENGRWGPFIRFQKKMLKLGKQADGNKYTPETIANIELDEVKRLIEEQIPGAFTKKVSAKKAAPKKSATKKAVAKKAAPKKAAKKAAKK
ncbi:MAG: topoisomerase C-terminal repeat-containing protein, partial [Sediminibacterium sp.]